MMIGPYPEVCAHSNPIVRHCGKSSACDQYIPD
jgi:hypothetical protein